MKTIRLTTSSTSLGNKGDHVQVGNRLAYGLIARGQAEVIRGKATPKKQPADRTASDQAVTDALESKTVAQLQEMARDMDISYAGLRKAELIKELKGETTTKEDKEGYQTK
jgi:hypothetical protein